MTYKITKTQGYKPDAKDERDNVFGSGATPAPIINPSGNWNDLFVADEFQYRGFWDTYGCVTFSFLNATEKLAKLLFNEEWNKSERYTYIASGTNPADKGASPRVVADSIRHKGVIDEQDLPFDVSIDSIEKFNSPKPLTQDLLDKALPFLQDYEFRYDFLPTSKGEVTREMLRAALYRSPVCIAVYAWAEKDGKYYRLGNDTHLTLLTNVKDNEELEVFDSYPPSHKTLSADFPIYTAIRVFLRKKTEAEKAVEEKKTNLILSIYSWIVSALQYIVDYKIEEKNALNSLPKPEVATIPLPAPEIAPQPATAPETMQEMVRRVCRTEKLTQVMSERLYRVVECESRFNPKAINYNRSKKTGKILSTDWGIAQFNDGKNEQGVPFWIGEGAAFASAEEVLNNPEKCIRVMAQQFKIGHARYWTCYQRLFK